MRERNVSHPKTSASNPGTASSMKTATPKCWKPCQYQGSVFQSRKTMKSGQVPLR